MQPYLQPSVRANDILVYGFIARTFSESAQGVQEYFSRLYPPTRYRPQFHGMSYSHGAWIVPGAGQVTLVVDFDVRRTQGIVVPQRQWAQSAYPESHHILRVPIFFDHQNGGVGFSLYDILQGHDSGLYNRDKEAPLDQTITTFVRISWPTYADWRREIITRDGSRIPIQYGSRTRNPLTRAGFMKAVGRSVEKFFNTPVANGHVDPRWGIGVHGITQKNVKIIGAIHASNDTWMPIIQLRPVR